MARRVEQIHQKGKSCRRRDRRQRNVAPEDQHQNPNTISAPTTACQQIGRKTPTPVATPRPPWKPSQTGKVCPSNGQHSRENHPARIAVGDARREPDGEIALGAVQNAAWPGRGAFRLRGPRWWRRYCRCRGSGCRRRRRASRSDSRRESSRADTRREAATRDRTGDCGRAANAARRARGALQRTKGFKTSCSPVKG